MDNSSCATSDDLDFLRSFNFLMSQAVDFSAILVTFLSSYFAISAVLKKSIFTLSTKILLLQNLFYGSIHQFSYAYEALELLYKSFFHLEEPCKLMKSELHCAPYLMIMLTGTSGMIYGQTGLMLERAFATFLPNYGKQTSFVIGGIISISLFISSAMTGRIILWNDSLQGYVIGCFEIPKQSFERGNLYFIICTVLTLINLAMSLAIMRYNKQYEYETRFKVKERFKKREVIDSTETICFLTFTQFIFMFIYSMGVMGLLNLESHGHITMRQLNIWIVWCYTIPFTAGMFPLLLIYRIQKTRALRSKKINDITKTKQTQEGHIDQMKNLWK